MNPQSLRKEPSISAQGYTMTTTRIAVHREDTNPIFGEGNIHICLDDEAGGCFVVLEQETYGKADEHVQRVRLDFDELEMVVQAVAKLRAQPAVKSS